MTAVLLDRMEFLWNEGTIEHLRRGESTGSMVKRGDHLQQADLPLPISARRAHWR